MNLVHLLFTVNASLKPTVIDTIYDSSATPFSKNVGWKTTNWMYLASDESEVGVMSSYLF